MLIQEMRSLVNHRSDFFGKLVGYLAHRGPKQITRHQPVQAQPQTDITVSQVQARVPVSILHFEVYNFIETMCR